jgi:hypothetical protein
MEQVTNWNGKMFKMNLIEKLFWIIDKRLFRWDHLPSLAKLRFVQKSYFFLLIIPLLDQFLSPILTLAPGSRVELNLGWIYLIPGEMKISFELGMPFTWKLIYFLVFFLGLGSVVSETFMPRIIGRGDGTKVTRQLVMQNFREVANGIAFAKRANHFIYDFAVRYTKNSKDLIEIPKSKINAATEVGEILVPLQDGQSIIRVNKYSVYYLAEHMIFIEEKLEDALESIVWFLNETRMIARWICGSSFLISICIFVVLLGQGFMRIVK